MGTLENNMLELNCREGHQSADKEVRSPRGQQCEDCLIDTRHEFVVLYSGVV